MNDPIAFPDASSSAWTLRQALDAIAPERALARLVSVPRLSDFQAAQSRWIAAGQPNDNWSGLKWVHMQLSPPPKWTYDQWGALQKVFWETDDSFPNPLKAWAAGTHAALLIEHAHTLVKALRAGELVAWGRKGGFEAISQKLQAGLWSYYHPVFPQNEARWTGGLTLDDSVMFGAAPLPYNAVATTLFDLRLVERHQTSLVEAATATGKEDPDAPEAEAALAPPPSGKQDDKPHPGAIAAARRKEDAIKIGLALRQENPAKWAAMKIKEKVDAVRDRQAKTGSLTGFGPTKVEAHLRSGGLID